MCHHIVITFTYTMITDIIAELLQMSWKPNQYSNNYQANYPFFSCFMQIIMYEPSLIQCF